MLAKLLLSIGELSAASEVRSEESCDGIYHNKRELLFDKKLWKIRQRLHLLLMVEHARYYNVIKRLLRVCAKSFGNLRYTFWTKCRFRVYIHDFVLFLLYFPIDFWMLTGDGQGVAQLGLAGSKFAVHFANLLRFYAPAQQSVKVV